MEDVLLDAGPSERGWHRLESAARCLRLYAWQHVAGISFPVTEPLVKGSLLHIGLAHYYERRLLAENGKDKELILSGPKAVVELARRRAAEAPEPERSLWITAAPIIEDAVRAYIERWAYEDSLWKIVSVEEELRANINGRLFTQRADLIVRDTHNKVWIVDHKSCYRIASKTLNQHILSGQFLGYQMFGRQKFGRDFAGVIINRMKLSEPYGYDRCGLEPAPAALKNFGKQLSYTEDSIERFEGKPVEDWPAVFSDQICFGKYGRCPAFDLCQWGHEDAV